MVSPHIALISRNNNQLAEELLAEQDLVLQEIYFPETLEPAESPIDSSLEESTEKSDKTFETREPIPC